MLERSQSRGSSVGSELPPASDESDEQKAIMGKDNQQIKFRKLLKEKLKVTNVPGIKLLPRGVTDPEPTLFSEQFHFEKFLGTGTFGFVVAATSVESQDKLAIKIVEAS